MEQKQPNFKVVYCKKQLPENVRAEKYIKFLKYLAELVREQEELSKNNK